MREDKNITEKELEYIVKAAAAKVLTAGLFVVPVGVSNKHIHLSRGDLDILFGRNYMLTAMRKLSQPGQFAAEECLEVIGKRSSFKRVRILGPLRIKSQVELSRTDCINLGIKAPVRSSGDLKGTPGIMLKGPGGILTLKEGVIVADRHIHLSSAQAMFFGLKNGDRVDVIVGGIKKGTMEDVLIRAGAGHYMDFHIDTDDANAFGLTNGSLVMVKKKRLLEE